MTSLFALILTVTSACGYSPLLNHTSPHRSPESVAIENDAERTCRMEFQGGLFCADFSWVSEPANGAEGSLNVYFWPKANPGVLTTPENFQLGVKLWMPDMGHGSQKVKVDFARDSKGDVIPGVFDATEILFVMGGEWEIQFQWKDAAGKILEAQKVPYTAP